MGHILKDMFQTPYFRIVVVADEETVELCGALKVSQRIQQYRTRNIHSPRLEWKRRKNMYITPLFPFG
jgi:hypothetical protein